MAHRRIGRIINKRWMPAFPLDSALCSAVQNTTIHLIYIKIKAAAAYGISTIKLLCQVLIKPGLSVITACQPYCLSTKQFATTIDFNSKSQQSRLAPIFVLKKSQNQQNKVSSKNKNENFYLKNIKFFISDPFLSACK